MHFAAAWTAVAGGDGEFAGVAAAEGGDSVLAHGI